MSLLIWFAGSSLAAPISFRNEVIPVLSRAGCSMGACHGNGQGKGGFKMSLRNEDPAMDFRVLTREFAGRRIDRSNPDESLLLRKAVARQAHEGGQRFLESSEEYSILREWIAQGALDDGGTAPSLVSFRVTPTDRVLLEPELGVTLKAFATFSNGLKREVTQLACYQTDNLNAQVLPDGTVRRQKFGETTVLVRYQHMQSAVRIAFVPSRPNYQWRAAPLRNAIDFQVDRVLRELKINSSEMTSDTEFLRRVFLDLLGVLPTAREARDFVSDPSPLKREHLVDEILSRKEFAQLWALKWGDLLRNEEKSLDPRGVHAFNKWLIDAFQTNMPMDTLARTILSARGSTYRTPAAGFYRAMRDPLGRAESVAQVFLGTRLQCAKCHNHPFERWTQKDYYDWADIFSQVKYRVLENRQSDGLDKHEFNGEEVIWLDYDARTINAKTRKPAEARFLGEINPVTEEDRLEALASWVTSPTNPWFAKVQVNRVWAQLFGRGLVDPVDDLRATNPGGNPALLDELAKDFVANGYNLKQLVRTVVLSRTYQLSSEPNETNADDESHFAKASVRRLTAEQLLDASSQVLQAKVSFRGQPAGIRAGEIPGGQRNPRGGQMPGDRFLAVFGKPERLLTCDCERSETTTMGQALQLVSGPTLHEMLGAIENRLSLWLKSEDKVESLIDDLYWSALSRPPSELELRHALTLFKSCIDENARRAAAEDIAWALLNSKEFIFRR